MTKILIHAENAGALASRLSDRFPDAQTLACHSNAELVSGLQSFAPDAVYSVRFDGRTPFPAAPLLAEGGPRWITVGGSGCDHLGPWDTRRVTVTNAAGVGAAMMAEFVLGCALHFTLDLDGLRRDKADCVWRDRSVVPLRGKTMLIVGLGQTGQAVAQRARAFDMHVIATRARPAPAEHVDEVFAATDLATLWPRADVICVSVPLLASTRGLVGADAFARMKATAILVDVSRGGVIVPDAAVEAMQKGRIAGAAFDVFHEEPLPADSPYWTLPNTIISPHASAIYDGWEIASFEMFLDNLARWRRGERLERIVDPARGY